MSKFTDSMIRGVVEEARLTNPNATRYLADVIIQRRDKTVRWGITRTNPLNRFEILNGGSPALAFYNAAVRLRLVQQTPEYEVRWPSFYNNAGTAGAIRATLDTVEPRAAISPEVRGPPDAVEPGTPLPRLRRICRGFRIGATRCWLRLASATVRSMNRYRSSHRPSSSGGPRMSSSEVMRSLPRVP